MSRIELIKQTKLRVPDILFFIMIGFPEIDAAIGAMKEASPMTSPDHSGKVLTFSEWRVEWPP